MIFLKKYKVVLAVILPVLILIIFRASGMNNFKPDAGRLAEPSITRSNLITMNEFQSLGGDKLYISLDKVVLQDVPEKILHIPTDSLLLDSNLKTINKNKGPVLLISAENTVSAKAWMVLSQLGIRDLYILSENGEPEKLKYEFRPDTLARPELNTIE